jgi:acyl-homoserine-lactone acylase
VDVTEACKVLATWDRTMDTDSRGALFFDRFWRKLTAAVPAARLWKVPFSAADPVHTPHTLDTAAPGFATALADTVAELRGSGTPLDARLGDHQYVVRGGERIAIPGGSSRLGVWNVIEPTWDAASGAYTQVPFGSSHLQAVGWDGSGCPVARTLLTYSQSSNPNSPHYSDQTRLLSGERWVTARFCEKDILSSPALRVIRVGEHR